MATIVPDDEVAAAPKRKALPFKRTVARKQQSSGEVRQSDDDNDLDLFRHSKEVFPAVLREAEEAEEERDQKQQDHKRRKLSSSSPDDSPYSRNRSTAPDESDDDLIMDVKGKGKEIVRPRRPSTPRGPSSAQIIPRTPRSSRGATKTPASGRSTSKNTAGSPGFPVTILDSDDSDSDVKPTASLSQQQQPNNPTTPPQAAPSKADPSSSSSSSPIEILSNPPNADPNPPDDFSEWITKARALQAAESQNAIVQVMTTSRLEGCSRPVIAQRRLNQTVQLLLKTWADRTPGLPRDIAAAVAANPGSSSSSSLLFLTWKGNKIYGHSTLASLGVQVDARGNLRNNRGEGYKHEMIHLEVWTDELYADYLANRGKERALKLGVGGDDGEAEGEDGLAAGGDADDEEAPQVVQPRRRGIRIVLKARDHEPLKLTTRDETNVETLIEAFRTQRQIGPEWEVAIWFDGERLDEETLVTDMDIDPDEANQLEVHVKKADR
ncbi:hypothetical protein C8A01DRAFT_14843 [Parachaetomium inaequale]|uniref:Ubiquitin-like domain-containing protein n=1 Tax=Parachaetomium inaequale TaxID=2588326 RepID=A0AAN6PI55_9PEZI|nr:hypothetical protein C8A01DRAFT_14843 [Parachaetomium inaequale]